MKDNLRMVKAKAMLSFEFEVALEDGEDVKRVLYEEAVAMIDPPFKGWTLIVEEK